MNFYLAGGMEYKRSIGKNWRLNITEKLADLGHSVLDPVQVELSCPEYIRYDWQANKYASEVLSAVSP